MMEQRTVRVATVNKTGHSYLVQQLSGPNLDRVNCWLEFLSVTFKPNGQVKKMSTEGTITFNRGEVTLRECMLTPEVARSLCEATAAASGNLMVRQSRHRIKPE